MSWKIWKLTCYVLAVSLVGIAVQYVLELRWMAPIHEKTDAWREIALQSTDAEKAASALDRYLAGMKELGLSEIDTAIFFPSPSTDLAEHELLIRQSRDHFNTLAKLERSSVEYSEGMKISRTVLQSTEADLSTRVIRKAFPWACPLGWTLFGTAVISILALLLCYEDAICDRCVIRMEKEDEYLRLHPFGEAA